jgi:proline iminopeptidase
MDRRDFVKASLTFAALGAVSGGAWSEEAEPAVERTYVTVNGVKLAVSMAGPENAPPMIVLHGGRGYGTHGGVFQTYLPLARKHRLIGLDMRGHGASEAVGPFTFDQIVDDIEALRLKIGGGQPMVLLGGSFGGMIALSYAVRYQHGLSHLILRGTAPSWHHEEGALKNFEARVSKAPMATPEMLHKLFTPNIESDEEFRLIMFALTPMYVDDPSVIDYNAVLTRLSRRIYRANVHNDLFADHSYDVVSQLPDIKVPTLVFCGENDWICPPDQSRLIASAIESAELQIVPDSNHGVPAEKALPLISDFLMRTS